MMNQFVESLKRLYDDGKLSKETVNKLYEDKKITDLEKSYILDAH